jgi:hypothetical protein
LWLAGHFAVGCGSSERDDRTGPAEAGTGGVTVGSGGSGTSGRGGGEFGSTNSGGSIGTTGGSGSGDGGGGATGTGGTAGSTPSGGAPPSGGMGGTSGTSGMGGMVGGAGVGGSGTPVGCNFTIDGSPSSAIPTVGIVTWSTDLPNLTAARVEFTLNGAAANVINRGGGGPISIEGATHRALLLGLKPEQTYTYRIVATAGSTECTSPDRTLTTGAKPAEAPSVTRTVMGTPARGFIVTSTGNAPNVSHSAFIIDADGEVVWWAPAPERTSRAHMSWEGTDMWMLAMNDAYGVGEVRRISMDGMSTERNVQGLERMHHDFTVLPGGIIAGLSWIGEGMQPSDLIERSPSGTIRTVRRLDATTYAAYSPPDFEHLAAGIAYQPASDTFTVTDNYAGLVVKISRQGGLLWQFGSAGCTRSVAAKCWSGFLGRPSGHQLLPNGTLVAFYNISLSSLTRSTVYEHEVLDTDTALTGSVTWEYSVTDLITMRLGDVQRLPNGNTLVVYSDEGDMREVTPDGDIVQILTAPMFGYASFRESLYGPPLR